MLRMDTLAIEHKDALAPLNNHRKRAIIVTAKVSLKVHVILAGREEPLHTSQHVFNINLSKESFNIGLNLNVIFITK